MAATPSDKPVESLPDANEKEHRTSGSIGEINVHNDQLQRHLGNRQIQLIAIGGTIGTGLFVSIGGGLAKGGPANLLLGYSLHALMICLINNSLAEMVCFMPVSGSFIRMAGRWVDDALGFLAGWNFFLYEAILIPFEITALNLVLTFWTDKIPVAAICVAVILLYAYGYSAHRLINAPLTLHKALLIFLQCNTTGEFYIPHNATPHAQLTTVLSDYATRE